MLAKIGLERPIFTGPGPALFSSGRQGLRRWPVRADVAHDDFCIGPPERLSPPQFPETGYFASSTNGLRTALVGTNRQLYFHTERDGTEWKKLAKGDVYGVTVDPGDRI